MTWRLPRLTTMTPNDLNRAFDAELPAGDARTPADAFRYHHSPEFPFLLESLGASLFVSTYQAGKLLVFRAAGGRMSLLVRSFDQAMGLAVDEKRLAIGTRYQIWHLRSAPDIAQQLEPRGRHDACYVHWSVCNLHLSDQFLADLLPFEEPVRHDETPPTLESVAKDWLARNAVRSSVSLVIRLPIVGSVAQEGITKASCRLEPSSRTIGICCVGETLYRGRKSGTSNSSNSVAFARGDDRRVKRPHTAA
jgi:hypothetical protein